jgi:NADH-quinone oxidoreductase subunit L
MLAALAWISLFAPLLAFSAIAFFTLPRHKTSAGIACAGVTLSFVSALALFIGFAARHFEPFEASLNWLSPGTLRFEFGLLIDRLSSLMLLVVTGVACPIFYYSQEYMRGDSGHSRYFAFLSLFVFSMLGIILSNNFLETFIFWELVGFASYALIGHWYEKEAAADAGKKAFLTTRAGDVGFLIGILVIWSLAGKLGRETLNFTELAKILAPASGQGPLAAAACLLVFLGVAGKSAQFPLHVWLPDAMEGPTPVSALIHAATMVAAGVYLLARTFFLFSLSPAALQAVASIGLLTAFLAATLALAENDIKRILAYSTLSQLGIMVMAVGLGSASAGMHHLVTHAFFKALLFLGAGCVIHATHRQNIWEMGGLAGKMPLTAWTFLVGFLALAGIFPLSGFFSKDDILAVARAASPAFFQGALAIAFLTSFYMGRLFFTAFLGSAREGPAHDPSPVMTTPLLVLAFFSIVSGFFGIGHFLHSEHEVSHKADLAVALASTAVALAGIGTSYLLYGAKIRVLPVLETSVRLVRAMLTRKYYIDDFYDFLIKAVQQNFARLCNLFEDRLVVGAMVNGTARFIQASGENLRLAATGRLPYYALMFAFGVALLAFFVIAGRVG